MYEWIGFLGMIFIDLCYLPQLYKTFKTKEVKDISIPFWVSLIVGLSLYWIYAYIVQDPVYMVSNTISLTFNIIMLIMIFRYRKR